MNAVASMHEAVQRYLDDRRRLGFSLKAPATELTRFARYADARGHRGPLTNDLMLGWAREHVRHTSAVTGVSEILCARRVRKFEFVSSLKPPAGPPEAPRLSPRIRGSTLIGRRAPAA